MKNNIFKRNILLLCLTALTLFSNTKVCLASGFGGVDANALTGGSPGGGGGGNGEIPFSSWTAYNSTSENKKYQYRYKSTLSVSTDININAYNLEGTSIIPYSSFIDSSKYTFKAGTWIGINATEIRSASWALLEFEVEEVKKIYQCKYTKPGGAPYCSDKKTTWTTEDSCRNNYDGSFTYGGGGKGNCSYCAHWSRTSSSTKYWTDPEKVDYYKDYTCPPTYPNDYNYKSPEITKVDETTESVTSGDIYNNVKNTIISSLHSTAVGSVSSSSGKVKYITDNSYPDNVEDLNPSTLEGTQSYYYDSYSSGATSGTVRKDYDFSPANVCINLKNAVVTYRTGECQESELKMTNGTVYEPSLGKNVNYWHYFIPLNAKSNSKFTIDIVKNGNETYNANQCTYFMKTFATDTNKKGDTYVNYIIPADETKTFIGDYNTKGEASHDWGVLTNKSKPGCQISMTVTFPISQEFYNEVEDAAGNISFKGFNFYYKPIDVSNPFPNGLSTNSLWSGYNLSNLTGASTTQNVTYVANTNNVSTIRNYTSEHPYTSWGNMYLDGRSGFIETAGVIVRNVKSDSFYKLGCGPANSDATNKFLYQARCSS